MIAHLSPFKNRSRSFYPTQPFAPEWLGSIIYVPRTRVYVITSSLRDLSENLGDTATPLAGFKLECKPIADSFLRSISNPNSHGVVTLGVDAKHGGRGFYSENYYRTL